MEIYIIISCFSKIWYIELVFNMEKIILWNFWKERLTWKKMMHVINFDTYYKTDNHWIVLYKHWSIVPFLYSVVAKARDIQNNIGDWHSLSKKDILFIMTELVLSFIISYFWSYTSKQLPRKPPHDRTMLYHINQIRQIRQKYLHIEFKVSKR